MAWETADWTWGSHKGQTIWWARGGPGGGNWRKATTRMAQGMALGMALPAARVHVERWNHGGDGSEGPWW